MIALSVVAVATVDRLERSHREVLLPRIRCHLRIGPPDPEVECNRIRLQPFPPQHESLLLCVQPFSLSVPLRRRLSLMVQSDVPEEMLASAEGRNRQAVPTGS